MAGQTARVLAVAPGVALAMLPGASCRVQVGKLQVLADKRIRLREKLEPVNLQPGTRTFSDGGVDDGAVRFPLPFDWRLRADWRLPLGRPGLAGRLGRLVLPAALRRQQLLCPPARLGE